MIKYLILPVAFFLCTSGFAAGIQANYYYSLFRGPDGKPYLETYIVFIGSSLNTVIAEGQQMAEAEISMIFTQDGNVKQFNKYNLKSPKVKAGEAIPNFIDQQRINIEPGLYNFEIKIRDVNNPEAKELVFVDVINVGFRPDFIEFSGIQYIEKYSETVSQNILSKNGYDLIPYVHDFFPNTMNRLTVYVEIYNTDKVLSADSVFLVKYGIEKVSGQQFIESYTKVKKNAIKPMLAILGDFNIDGLPSGNYHFRIDVVDKNNNIITTKRSYFQRSNPQTGVDIVNFDKLDKMVIDNTFIEEITSSDTLNDYLKCLLPVANDREKGVILDAVKNTDTTMKQVIFYTFWKSRNYLEVENEWLAYKEKVAYVNKAYGSSIKKGYESDRGRVFLQYGEPNNVQKSDFEPSAYPYEIWHYYVIGNQRDKRFVFYNPMLVGDDYQLLHSDAQGEIYDKNWERRLHERNNTMYNPDATNSDEQWGSKAIDNFNK